jgi:hypothetical protein
MRESKPIKTLAPCAQNLILRLEELTRTTCHISQIIDFFFNAFSICGTQEFIFFLKFVTHLIMLIQLGAHILAHLFQSQNFTFQINARGANEVT